MVISVKLPIDNSIKTHHYFKLINNSIIAALTDLGIKQSDNKGVSIMDNRLTILKLSEKVEAYIEEVKKINRVQYFNRKFLG